jgi:hypothetical protein
VPHYTCLDSKRRGNAICINRVALRQDLLDRAILGAIGDALDPAVLTGAMEKVLARLTKRQHTHIERRAQVERDLAQVQQRLDRLVDALADGSLPADEIKTRLTTEKARKTALTADFSRLERVAKVASLNIDQIAQKLRARVNDVAGVLGRQTVQARQMLRKILADKIELEPVGSGRHRGYKFRGTLNLERLIEGEAMNNTSDGGGPNGIRHPLQLFRSVASSIDARRKTSRVRNPRGVPQV